MNRRVFGWKRSAAHMEGVVLVAALLLLVLFAVPAAMAASPGPTGTVSIENGAAACNSVSVTLTLTYARAQEMHFSNDDGATWSDWEPVAATKSWTLSDGPDGSRSVAVEYRKVRPAIVTSAIIPDTIILDRTAPTTGTVPGPDATFYNTAIPLTFADWSDPAPSGGLGSFFYDITGQGEQSLPLPLVGPILVSVDPATLAEGAQTVTFHATDAAGNAEAGRSVVRYTDLTAPVTSDDYDGLWHSQPFTVGLSAVDDGAGVAGTYYSSNAGISWTQGNQVEVDPPAAFSGTATIEYYSVDATQPAGNSETPHSVDLSLDTVAPVSTVDSTADLSAPHNTDVTLALGATDEAPGSGLARVEYRIDGGDWVEATEALVPALADHSNDGAHVVDVRATDHAGNVEEPQSVHVVIDTTGPAVTIGGAYASWHSSDVPLTFTAVDPQPGAGLDYVEYSLDGGTTWVHGGEATVQAADGDGSVSVAARAVDLLGNRGGTQTATVNIDTTAPTSQVTGRDDAWHGANVALHISATDPTPGAGAGASYYRLDGGNWTEAPDGQIIVPATADHSGDGLVTVQYYSEDMAVAPNAEEPRSLDVKIDTTAPVSSLAGTDAAWHRSAVTLTLAAADAGAGVGASYYRLDTSDWMPATGGLITVPAPADHSGDGVVRVHYYSTDKALPANAEAARSVDVKIDTTAPVTSVSGADDRWHTSPVIVTFSSVDAGSGVAYTQYSLDDGLTWVKGDKLTVSQSAVATISYRSVDELGNAEAVRSMTVKVDTIGPRLAAKKARGSKGVALRLKYKATDNLSVKVHAVKVVVKDTHGKTVKSFKVATAKLTGTWYSVKWKPLKKGTYTYRISAKDEAGLKQSKIGSAKVVVR